MKILVWVLIVALIVLHQDYWQWNDTTLLWGFFPRTLAYHSALSMLAAVVWFMATQFCWPKDLIERTMSETEQGGAE